MNLMQNDIYCFYVKVNRKPTDSGAGRLLLRHAGSRFYFISAKIQPN
jgi:hypothetical protein